MRSLRLSSQSEGEPAISVDPLSAFIFKPVIMNNPQRRCQDSILRRAEGAAAMVRAVVRIPAHP
jgi:hypothetical protein